MADYTAAIKRLAAIPDGWSPGRKAPTEAALATASNMTVCPLSDGSVQVEMHAGGADIEIEIGPDGLVDSVMWLRKRST
jgi:hypothetical protein